MRTRYPDLPDVIRAVQLQLEEAQRRRISEGRSKFLRLKQLEFEMKCVVQESEEVPGQFDLKVVGFGSDTKVESHYCHTIRVIFEGNSGFTNNYCSECGQETMVRKDGCDFCSSCGAVGSCG